MHKIILEQNYKILALISDNSNWISLGEDLPLDENMPNTVNLLTVLRKLSAS